ncbi:hypothetical protein D3C81_897360 [compost metagenome]
MYSIGGWTIRPKSCNSGLRSRPLVGTCGSRRWNGLEVTIRKLRKPTLIMPITASTRASMTCGNCRENTDTAKVQPPRISAQSSSEPSWAPHTALNL